MELGVGDVHKGFNCRAVTGCRARRVFRGLKPTATIMASRCEAGGGEQFAPMGLEES